MSWHNKIISHRRHSLGRQPAPQAIFNLHMTSKADAILVFGTRHFPEIAIAHPVVRYFDLPTVRRRVLQDTHERAREGVQQLASSLMEFESNASVRLTNALQLLNVSAVSSRLQNADAVCEHARRLVPEALYVSGLMSELGPMRILFRRVAALYGQVEKNQQNRRLYEKIVDQMQKLHKRLETVQRGMKGREYPFNTEKMTLTMVGYLLPVVPDDDDLFGLVTVTQALYEKLAGLQVRLFAHLAHTAEQVETIVGLPPLPEPDFRTTTPSPNGTVE